MTESPLALAIWSLKWDELPQPPYKQWDYQQDASFPFLWLIIASPEGVLTVKGWSWWRRARWESQVFLSLWFLCVVFSSWKKGFSVNIINVQHLFHSSVFLYYNFLNWRIIVLQYCVDLCPYYILSCIKAASSLVYFISDFPRYPAPGSNWSENVFWDKVEGTLFWTAVIILFFVCVWSSQSGGRFWGYWLLSSMQQPGILEKDKW